MTILLDFYFELPQSVMIKVMSNFALLTGINLLSNNCIICNEGCYSVLINYDPLKSRYFFKYLMKTRRFFEIFLQ